MAILKKPRLRGYPPELKQALARLRDSAVRRDVEQIAGLLKTLTPEQIELLKNVAFEGATASSLEATDGGHHSKWNSRIRAVLRSVARFYEIPVTQCDPLTEPAARKKWAARESSLRQISKEMRAAVAKFELDYEIAAEVPSDLSLRPRGKIGKTLQNEMIPRLEAQARIRAVRQDIGAESFAILESAMASGGGPGSLGAAGARGVLWELARHYSGAAPSGEKVMGMAQAIVDSAIQGPV